MKSKLFGQFDPKDEKNKQFVTDVKAACQLSEAQRRAIAQALPALIASRTAKETEDRTAQLEKETGATRLTLGHAADLAAFFMRQFLDDDLKSEAIEDWCVDLVELGILGDVDCPVLVSFLQELKDKAVPAVSKVRKQRLYGAGVFPSMRSCGTTVELRGVFEKPYRWGTPLAEYKPVIEEVVPIISVHITLDSGHNSDVAFQVTPEEISLLIDELTAAKIDAKLLSERLALAEPQVG